MSGPAQTQVIEPPVKLPGVSVNILLFIFSWASAAKVTLITPSVLTSTDATYVPFIFVGVESSPANSLVVGNSPLTIAYSATAVFALTPALKPHSPVL